jgi:hypothetical protein
MAFLIKAAALQIRRYKVSVGIQDGRTNSSGHWAAFDGNERDPRTRDLDYNDESWKIE